MLARVFAGRNTGFYVDVGAADPVNLSVTKWFYDLGWSGINIEPNKKLFVRLAADRPRDINLECGVGAAVSEALFFEPEVGELSTFDAPTQALAQRAGTAGTTRAVPVFPLTDLLKRHRKKRDIDFLKIDVEGWEHEVLKGLDLSLYRPTVIVIESTIPQSRAASHARWEPLVVAANYTFAYFDGVNRFYLANESIELKKHFDSPPNAFDDFEPFPLVRARTDAEERLKSIHQLEGILADLQARLADSERDREARLAAVQDFQKRLNESERDREARLVAMQNLQKHLSESELDREARLVAMQSLEKLVAESERHRDDLARRLSDSDRELKSSKTEIRNLERDLLQANASLKKILDSRFWKITHPKWLRFYR